MNQPKDPCGPVENRAAWPRPIEELVDAAAEEDINIGPVRVYLSRVDWIEKYYCVQMSDSAELTALMAKRWPLKVASPGHIPIFWRDMPAAWANPNATTPRSYSAYTGERSDNVIVMHDSAMGVVYVWYWFNF
jgi:hypothetical protein